ncbi:hypothetical protein FMEAI12_3410002 [Parafrankia sp. Ea1.12]|nr:hypothetical protein FMEAI12_3410002 [Parafrankia sp. Ea1.12]
MPTSISPKPEPPYCSGRPRPTRPSSSDSRVQTSSSRLAVESIRRRTAAAGDRSARKSRTARRNCSCSAVKLSLMSRPPLYPLAQYNYFSLIVQL